MKALPIVTLEIEGEKHPYFADRRLGEYRSVDGSAPWIVSAEEVDGDMETVIREFPYQKGA